MRPRLEDVLLEFPFEVRPPRRRLLIALATKVIVAAGSEYQCRADRESSNAYEEGCLIGGLR